MMTKINLDRLGETEGCYDLFQIASRASGQTSGTAEIDISALRIAPSTRMRLAEWSILPQQPIIRSAEPSPAQPLAVQPKPVEPQIDMAEVEREEQADIQRAADKAAGKNRLNDYAASGLEDTQANAAAIKQWLDENVKGYLSEQAIDLAVQWLGPRGKDVLTWKPKTVASPLPAHAASSEALQDWQLPINADERTMKKASVRALKDLLARRRAATNQKFIRRGFGAKF